FYAKVMAPEAKEALQLLWTLVSDPWLKAEDMDRERLVIAEEIAETEDNFSDAVEQQYMQTLFAGTALGHDVLGDKTHLAALTAWQLQQFHRRWYQSENMVLAVAGQGVEDILKEAEKLPALAGRFGPALRTPLPPITAGSSAVVRKRAEQVHVMIGGTAPALNQEEYAASVLLATVMGGQNSSRLWQRLREQEGLVYTVSSDYSAQEDWGDFSTYFSVNPKLLPEALKAVAEEMAIMMRKGPGADELKWAQVQAATTLAFAQETPDGRVQHLGSVGLSGRVAREREESLAQIYRVTPQTIQELSQKLWADPHKLAAVAVGPVPQKIGDLRHEILAAVTR
ncbi:MAG: pitrilysin family protein, partial [Firmicutes bacterium]|nr:pitrilysin family protein [Bacillota bacterium]